MAVNFPFTFCSGIIYFYGMRLWLYSFLLLAAFSNAFAIHIAVLEIGADESVKETVSLSDRQYLTNVLREQAVKELPAEQNYTIMMRGNVPQELPPGDSTEETIKADYICQAQVGSFGGALTLSAELYETSGNKLVASFNGRGANVNELLDHIEKKSPEFFRRVKELTEIPSATEKEQLIPVAENVDTVSASAEIPPSDKANVEEHKSEEKKLEELSVEKIVVDSNSIEQKSDSAVKVGESIPPNVENKNHGVAGWVILGASSVVAVTGGVLAFLGNSMAKKAADRGGDSVKELEKNKDDAESGQVLRGVGIGLAIAGALGVGISFAF